MSCPDCGFALFGKQVIRVDTMQVTLTCPRCHAAIRVSATKLHDGDPKIIKELPSSAYTYDKDHNRIALSDLSRPTSAESK
jgi:uncharacterized Zn finger protein